MNVYLFESLSQVKELAWYWQQDYNFSRTHESLNHLPPKAYRKQLENSSLGCLNQWEWTIGRVIYRGQTKSIDSNKIVIVIDKDPLIPNGYRIQTAYPH